MNRETQKFEVFEGGAAEIARQHAKNILKSWKYFDAYEINRTLSLWQLKIDNWQTKKLKRDQISLRSLHFSKYNEFPTLVHYGAGILYDGQVLPEQVFLDRMQIVCNELKSEVNAKNK
jgi:hypothetical protein